MRQFSFQCHRHRFSGNCYSLHHHDLLCSFLQCGLHHVEFLYIGHSNCQQRPQCGNYTHQRHVLRRLPRLAYCKWSKHLHVVTNHWSKPKHWYDRFSEPVFQHNIYGNGHQQHWLHEYGHGICCRDFRAFRKHFGNQRDVQWRSERCRLGNGIWWIGVTDLCLVERRQWNINLRFDGRNIHSYRLGRLFVQRNVRDYNYTTGRALRYHFHV
jgi:hypothetical protein